MADISTKPYLIRAIHSWCEDSGYRPYIAVVVDQQTQVPMEFVRNGEIVLNVSAQATNRLRIGNELIEFEARFSGAVRSVSIPIDNVSAIYAQETGHGMAFDVVRAPALEPQVAPVPETKRTERVVSKPRLVPTPKPDTTAESSGPRGSKSAPVSELLNDASGETKRPSLAEPSAEVAPERKTTRSPRRRKTTAPVDEAQAAPTPTPVVTASEPAPTSAATPETDRPGPEDPGQSKPARAHLKRIK